jgi:hypothetical protein
LTVFRSDNIDSYDIRWASILSIDSSKRLVVGKGSGFDYTDYGYLYNPDSKSLYVGQAGYTPGKSKV